jgi:hypothetical protein
MPVTFIGDKSAEFCEDSCDSSHLLVYATPEDLDSFEGAPLRVVQGELSQTERAYLDWVLSELQPGYAYDFTDQIHEDRVWSEVAIYLPLLVDAGYLARAVNGLGANLVIYADIRPWQLPPATPAVKGGKVPRRLRYEIFRRDNFACRYCGRTPPEVQLTVDHVTPRALGGTNDPSNLVTACADCNGGKSSVPPDAAIVDDVAADALRWARAKQVAAEEIRRNSAGRLTDLDDLSRHWTSLFPRNLPILSAVERQQLSRWMDAGVPAEQLFQLMEVTAAKQGLAYGSRWPYFAGCVWNTLRRLDERATELIAQGVIE